MPESRRIVIVGGGFAGTDLARALRRQLPDGWEVLLFSRENHFVFTPLLAEVVGSAISPLHTVWPSREMAPSTLCRTVPVVHLDPDAREVLYRGPVGETLRERYDHLVIACGLATDLGVVKGMGAHGWPLKGLGDAVVLRNHLIQQLERAEAEPDAKRRAQLLSFAVVGGGFTGVELAGSLMDLFQDASRLYKRFSSEEVRVTLIDRGDRILSPLPEGLSRYADRSLQGRGIDIRTRTRVQEVRGDGLVLDRGEFVTAGTTISAVGNTVQQLVADTKLPLERGRILVSPEMRVQGYDDVWALGDCARVPNAWDGRDSPTLAQFAMRQATQLAENLVAVIAGRKPKPFQYHMQGMFAAIGHGKAVGNPFGVQVSGLPAYLMWRAIYWAKMPSWVRKTQIAVDWGLDLFFPRDIVEISTIPTSREPTGEGQATPGLPPM